MSVHFLVAASALSVRVFDPPTAPLAEDRTKFQYSLQLLFYMIQLSDVPSAGRAVMLTDDGACMGTLKP